MLCCEGDGLSYKLNVISFLVDGDEESIHPEVNFQWEDEEIELFMATSLAGTSHSIALHYFRLR